MNSLVIAGNLTRDAEVRVIQSGEKVTKFSVAVNEGRDKTATFFDCSLWGERGEKLAPYLRKGKRVTVSGRISARCHEGKAYLQLAARKTQPALKPRAFGGKADDMDAKRRRWKRIAAGGRA